MLLISGIVLFVFFQRAGKLIWTGCIAAAGNVFERLDDLVDGHASGQRSDTLRVAGAACDKMAMGQNAVFHFKFDGTAAGAVSLVHVHDNPPEIDVMTIFDRYRVIPAFWI